jgi:hypothetical protein
MRRIKKYWLLIFVVLIVQSACKKEEPPIVEPPVLDGGVYILNEGNYQWGNGRIDYLRFADNVYSTDVFETVNSRPLGDVVQSMTALNGRGYIVVNNSSTVEVVEMAGFTSVGTISSLTSPRYLLPINDQTAYISDLYSKCIHIVNLSTLLKTGSIPLKGSTEEMLKLGETVFVTNTRTSYIYLINSTNNTLIDSIAVGFASNSIAKDIQGKLWVMCAGDEAQGLHATLYRVDPVLKQVMLSFDLGNSLQIWDKLRMNASGERLYFMNNGVWSLPITANSLPIAPLIAADGRVFHGLGIDPNSENIYVSDAADYVQNGRIYRYRSDGTAIDYLSAGIIPSEFFFY